MEARNVKILLVDDDSDYRRLVKMALQRATGLVQLAIETAENLAETLDCLKNNSFDLVLLDLGLPDSSGIETFNAVHRLHPRIPIIMLTGLEDQQVSIEAIKKGASDYLVKGANSFTDILVRTILYALERKQTEETLQISERNFRTLINQSADATLVIDKCGIILFANPAAQTLFEHNAEELLGKSFEFPIADAIEIEIVRKYKAKAIAEMRIVETNWQGKDAYLASLRDITKRKSAEEKLKKYRENLKVLVKERTEEVDAEKELLSVTFSSMGDGVIVADPQKRIILFNTIAETLAGWEFERVQDRPLDELFQVVNEHTKEAIESPVDRVLKSGKTETGSNLDVLVAMDETERPISTIAAPIYKNDGTIIGIVLVFRDVSKEREIDRLKDDFISSVSHELRTPLTSIKAYTETILHDSNMPEETKRQFLGIIDEESNRLANLIEELLDLSRLESGTVKLLREPMNISAVITQVSTALKPLAEKKNIQLNVNVCENLPQFIGDESKILSAITNLVNNAVKFTPAGGQVSVSATTSGQDELVIRVSDSGIGIPKEALPKIFDRFYRVHHPGKQIPGTGLGLAIVKKIVTMHGGRIEVESEPNRGTTFTIFLPLTPTPIQEARQAIVADEKANKSAPPSNGQHHTLNKV